jgi:Spy/CpxP family protein refolding chaperone
VRTIPACWFVIVLAGISAVAWAGAQQARPASTGALTVDEMLTAFRADMQSSRADLLAKDLTLTAEQAAKFWPLFAESQKEQNVIMGEQLSGIQAYVEGYQTIDDATSLTLINAHFPAMPG